MPGRSQKEIDASELFAHLHGAIEDHAKELCAQYSISGFGADEPKLVRCWSIGQCAAQIEGRGVRPLARLRHKASTKDGGHVSSYDAPDHRTMVESHDGLRHRTTPRASCDGPEHRKMRASCNDVRIARHTYFILRCPLASYDGSIVR